MIAGALAVVAVLVTAIFGWCLWTILPVERAARPHAEEWLTRLASGDYAGVLERSTEEFRRAAAEADLRSLRDRLDRTGPDGLTVVERQARATRPRMFGLRGHLGGAAVEIVLREEDGGWKVKAVSVGVEIARRAGMASESAWIDFDAEGIRDPPLRPLSRRG